MVKKSLFAQHLHPVIGTDLFFPKKESGFHSALISCQSTHKARDWDTDDAQKTFYDPNKNAVAMMHATKTRRGNPALPANLSNVFIPILTSILAKKHLFSERFRRD